MILSLNIRLSWLQQQQQKVASAQSYATAATMFNFPLTNLPDVPLRIICDFLTVADKKNLRLVNKILACAVIALDPVMRLWTVNLDKAGEYILYTSPTPRRLLF